MADQTTPVLKILRGNVGIGTASPSFQLTVVETGDSVKADFTNNVNANFRIKTSGTAAQIGPSTSSNLEIQTGNTTRLTVDSSGNVGIGTTSPGYKLDVTSSSNTTFRTATTGTDRAEVAILKNSGTAQQWTLSVAGTTNGYSVADKYFYIADTTGGTTPLVIDKSGNVGIGTTSPSYPLTVAGADSIGIDDYILHNGDGNTKFGFSGADTFKIRTGGVDALFVNSSQNVGIGTASPSVGLHLERASENNVLAVVGQDGYNSTLFLAAEGSGKDTYLTIGGNRNLQIDFATSTTPAATGTNKFTFSKLGRLGIGTTSPSEKLSIASGDISLTTGYGIHAVNGGNENGMFFHAAAAGNSGNLLNFKTDGSERMRIDSSGNIGIGTTSPDYELEVSTSSNSRIAATSVTNSVVNHLQADSSGGYVGPLSNHSLFIKTNNTTRWTINTSGNLIGAGGQILYSDGDILFPGASANLNWDKSESELLLQDGAKVGIGTTSPDRALHLYSSSVATVLKLDSAGADTGMEFAHSDTVASAINSSNDGSLEFRAGGNSTSNEKMRITSGGNVGIGVNPGSILHVKGSDPVFTMEDTSAPGTARIQALNGSLILQSDVSAGVANSIISFKIDNTEYARFNSDGYLGIGTTSPTSLLHIDTGANSAANFRLGANRTSANAAVGQLIGDWNGTIVAKIALKTGDDTTNKDDGEIAFEVAAAGTTAEAMRIQNDGNVGIGTASPVAKLDISVDTTSDVVARISNEDNTTATADAYLHIVTGGTSGGDAFTRYNILGSCNWSTGIDNSDSDKYKISFSSNLGTNDYITVKQDGNVGIGTASPSFNLHIENATNPTIRIKDTTNSSMLDLRAEDSSVLIRSTSNYPMRFDVNQTERMRLDTSGNLGIGTTSPDVKLHVSSGDIRIGNGNKVYLYESNDVNYLTYNKWEVNTSTALAINNAGTGGFQIQDAGTAVLFVGTDSTYGGNVGIGTTSPTQKLHVYVGNGSAPTDSNTHVVIEDSDHSYLGIYGGTSSDVGIHFGDTAIDARIKYENDNRALKFAAGGTSDQLTINSSGDVGIGVSPSTRLHVSNPAVGQSGSAVTSITTTQATDLGVKLSFTGGANSDGNIIGGIALGNGGEEYAGIYALDGGSSAATDLAFFVGDTNGINEAVHIDSGGTVQINSPSSSGTRSLTVKLTDNTSGAVVFEQSSNEYLKINTTNGSEKIILGDNGTNPKINFNGEYDFPTADGTSGQVLTTDGSGTLSFSSAGSGTVSGSGTNGNIAIWTDTSALGNSVFYQNNGLIGLGTTSPTVKLDVRATGADSTELLRLQSDGDVTNGGYHWMTAEIAAGQSTDANIIHIIGKAESSKNSGYFGFNYQGDGSDSNFITLGGYSANNLLNIKMDGNVGIGTTTPERNLHVFKGESSGAASNSDSTLVLENNSHTYVQFLTPATSESGLLFGDSDNDRGALTYNHSNDSMNFRIAASTRMFINSSGNVGIGYTSPTEKLFVKHGSVNTTIARFTGANNDRGLIIGTAVSGSTNDSVITFDAVSQNSVGQHAFKTDGTERVRIDESGNVGIGTTSPGDKLDVSSGHINISNDYGVVWGGGTSRPYIIGNKTNGTIVFGEGGSEHLRIDTSGNLGIGTTSPAQKLDVAGNVKHEGLTMTSGTDIDQLTESSQSLTITTDWQDTGIAGSTLATGTYIVQLYANDNAVGGGQYSVYYSGTMSWFGTATNDTDFNSEIVLHRAGHADNDKYLYLRTVTHASGTLSLEIAGNYTATGASTYTFKFRRMI